MPALARTPLKRHGSIRIQVNSLDQGLASGRKTDATLAQAQTPDSFLGALTVPELRLAGSHQPYNPG